MIDIKCLRLTLVKPRVAQPHRYNTMTRLHVFAVLAGLITIALAQYCGVELHNFAYGRCCQTESPAVIYISSRMKIIAEILYLLPGFVTGYIARTRGIFTGFVTGTIGGAAASVFSATLLLGVSAWHEWTFAAAVPGILGAGIVSGIACAAAGGAGELVRSRNRLERR